METFQKNVSSSSPIWGCSPRASLVPSTASPFADVAWIESTLAEEYVVVVVVVVVVAVVDF